MVAASFARAQALGEWASVVLVMGLVAPQHVESSWTRDQTHVPCILRKIPIHCTTKEVHSLLFLLLALYHGPRTPIQLYQ